MTDQEFLKEKENMKEEWKQIILEGELQNYDVSNTGKYRNHETQIEYKLSKVNGMKNTYEFAILKLNSGKTHKTGIHRLMGIMFIPIPLKYLTNKISLDKLTIDHIDNVKYHNIITNLQWLTGEENTLKAMEDPINVRSMSLTNKEVKKICEDLMQGETIYDIATKYNFSETTIYKIRYHMAYTHITEKYNFPTVRISNSDVETVCKLIMDKKTFNEIHDITGISLATIAHISNGDSWKYITCKYEFPNRKIMTPEKRELILQICEMLSNGKSPSMVSKELDISKSFVQHIALRENYTELSKGFVFNYDKFKVSDETVHNICKDLVSGSYFMKDIATRNNVSITFVKDIKYRRSRTDISDNYKW